MIPASLLEIDLTAPLTDTELARLDTLLFELGERMDTGREEMADSVRDVSELDGFMLAVASCPVELATAEWLPAVWDDERPPFASEAEAEEVVALVLRHYNAMVRLLQGLPDAYEPLFAYDVDEAGQEFESVEEWCGGFLRGMELAWSAWQPLVERELDVFAVLQLFGTAEGWEEQESYPAEELEALQDGLPDLARTLNLLGMAQRAATPTFRREAPKVGRNDPCPCGSGRKYKQCCAP